MHPSVSKSRNEWHSSWRVLVAVAVLRKLVTSVNTVVVTQIVLLHTQPVVAVPLTLSARELAWQQTTLSSSLHSSFSYFHSSAWSVTVTPVIFTNRDRHFHSPWLPFPFTLIVISMHLDRHFHSHGQSFPFTLVAISIYLDRHFQSPWSSFPITWIVIYIHHHRHFYSTLLLLKIPFTFIVSCIHPHCHFHRHFHSP